MAKKASSKARDEGKTRFELRFDEELYTQLKATADRMDISVNRLMQGITRWAIDNANPGEEVIGEYPEGVAVEKRPGCIWFGKDAKTVEVQVGPAPDEVTEETLPPQFYFALDFTERGIVREPTRTPLSKEDDE